MRNDSDSTLSIPFFANWITRSIRAVFLLAFLLYPFQAKAQDQGIESLRQTGKAFATVAKDASPAVVFIQVEKVIQQQPVVPFFPPFGEGGPFGDDFFRRFFGTPQPRQPEQFDQAPQ